MKRAILLDSPKGASLVPVNNTTASVDTKTVFCVDDNLMIGTLAKQTFRGNSEIDIHYFEYGKEAVKYLHLQPEVMILDYNLEYGETTTSPMNGLDVLEKVKTLSPSTKVIMMSSQKDISIALKCLKIGATDYIVKDEKMKTNLAKSVNSALKSIHVKEEILELSQKIKRDKLLIKGYFAIAILTLSLLISYLV